MEPLPFKSILHPTDFSQSGEIAFAHALRLAIAARSALHVVHVGEDGGADADRFPSAEALLRKWRMLDEATTLEKDLGVNLSRTTLDSDNIAGAISDYAESHACDLLVLQAHGASWMGRLLKGSVAEASARLTHAPALFLREGDKGFVDPATGKIRMHRILMPVASNVSPMHAWGVAAPMARALDPLVEFHLLHVGDSLPTSGNMLPYIELKRGPVLETILETAEHLRPDLIVMATTGHHDLFDDLRGSTTERVMRLAPCPVLAVPMRR